MEMGMRDIVVNAADVATSQKDLQKDDPTDSRKLARSLRSGDLKAIYFPSPSTLGARSLVRMRATLIKDMIRFKQHIKSFLYFYLIGYPQEFEKSGTHWSKRFMKWLDEEISLQHEAEDQALKILLQGIRHTFPIFFEIRSLLCL